MTCEDAERIRVAATVAAFLIKPLTDEVNRNEVDWSRPYLVGFIRTLIGLHFGIVSERPRNSDEWTKAIAIAWEDITGELWTDELMRRGEEFNEGANNASRFVRFVHFEGKVRDGPALWREVFVSYAISSKETRTLEVV